jgi:hypothetical protein
METKATNFRLNYIERQTNRRRTEEHKEKRSPDGRTRGNRMRMRVLGACLIALQNSVVATLVLLLLHAREPVVAFRDCLARGVAVVGCWLPVARCGSARWDGQENACAETRCCRGRDCVSGRGDGRTRSAVTRPLRLGFSRQLLGQARKTAQGRWIVR